MRFRITTLLFLLIPAAIGGYSGALFLQPHFRGPSGQFANGINIGAVLGAIMGLSLGALLASHKFKSDSGQQGVGRSFQFTIRELGLVLTLGCLILGWIVDHRLLRAENKHWTNYLTAVCHRLEAHGELVFTRDKHVFMVSGVSSEKANGHPFFSVSKGMLSPPVPVPVPSDKPPSQ